MDWVKVRSKRREIIAVFTVLMLMFCFSFQWVAADADPEGQIPPDDGGEFMSGDPGAEDPDLGGAGSADGEGGGLFAPFAADTALDSVTFGTGGNDQEAVIGDEIGKLLDASSAYQFRLYFSGTQPTQADLESNVRVAKANNNGTGPGGVNQNIAVAFNIQSDHVRVQVAAGAMSPDTTYFLVVSSDLTGGVAETQIKFATKADAPSSAAIALTEVRCGNGTGGGWGSLPVVQSDEIAAPLDASAMIQLQLSFSGTNAADMADLKAGVRVAKANSSDPSRPGGANQNQPLIDGNNSSHIDLRLCIEANILDSNAIYYIVIGQSITGGAEKQIKFTTKDNAPPEPTDLAAIFRYPMNGSKNTAANQSILVEFNMAVERSTVTEAGNVVLKNGSNTVPVQISLDSAGKTLTVKPSANLAYGTDYELLLTDKIAASGKTSEFLPESKLSFSTSSFAITNVSAPINGDSMGAPQISITNLSGANKTANIVIEVRRDLGARLESGGTVVYINKTPERFQNLPPGAQALSMPPAGDVGKDLYGSAVSGDTYIDVYVLDGQGNQIGNSFHKAI